MSDDQVGGVQSVTRAVRALELIAEEGELGVTDLGRGLGVHKATASRLAATLSGGGVVYVDQVSSAHLVATTNWVGRRTPLHGSSSGKVFLAHMPEPERQRILERPLEALTRRTMTDPARLRRQLEEVRVRGYATIQDELEEGLNAVAAPVWRSGGDLVAALSVSGPSFRVRSIDLPRLGRLTVDAADAVSWRLGHAGRRGD